MTTQLGLKTGSQASKILARLRKARGGWVSLGALVQASGSYAVATRVSNINDALWKAADSVGKPRIQNKTERGKDGTIRSFYRLAS